MGTGSLNVEEAFLIAMDEYHPGVYRGSAVVFRARDQLTRLSDPSLGWRHFVHGEIAIREVSGDHDTLLDEPHISDLAHQLNTCLQQALDQPVCAEQGLVPEPATVCAAKHRPQLATVGQSA